MNLITQLVAWVELLLSMAGYSPVGTEFSHKVSENHRTTLYSTAIERNGVAEFECKETSSGVCHYTLYRQACTDADACHDKPLQIFAVKRGESKAVQGLSKFHPCVSSEEVPLGPDCGLSRYPD